MTTSLPFRVGPKGFDLSGPLPRLAELGHVHFLGIGGIGMSGIARIMLQRGVEVSGSDAAAVPALEELAAWGARVGVGFDPGRLSGVDTVVCSSAVRPGNPELRAARDAGLRVLHRSQALAVLMANRRAVAVTGTNGKTTTTAMLTEVLRHAGMDPSFAIGGQLISANTNGWNGSGDTFVAEADESDASFLVYRPQLAILTNAQADHLDHYGTSAGVAAAFAAFVDSLGAQGVLVGCLDDPGAARLVRDRAAAGLAAVGYGRAGSGTGSSQPSESSDADPAVAFVRIVDEQFDSGTTAFTLRGDFGEQPVTLAVPGRHNVDNATGAFCAALQLGVSPAQAVAGLAAFTGTRRRFEVRGRAGGVSVVDDYAHNPPKVAAAVATARQSVGDGGRVVAVFQPHLYSRTRDFAHQFGQALSAADLVAVTEVYPAREDPIPGVSGRLVADHVGAPVTWLPQVGHVPGWVRSVTHPGDLVLLIGAGDITAQAPCILQALGGQPQAGQPQEQHPQPGPASQGSGG
ncbi:MAG: UDP-N-acetylmuramate--L-alanine ligase [Micrococcales bacterium]|nr:MAG: UDP-N-acetylmuramate--L-alanine ligase [Micrococcales bacterium]